MAALVASWIFGARALSDGYEELSFYRGERPDVHAMADQVPSAEAREAVAAAGERWLTVKEAARNREMPFGAASLLLGAVMVLFSARSMAGREGARSGLVQIVVVHAGVIVAGFLMTRDVTLASIEFQMRVSEGITRGLSDPAALDSVRPYLHVIERLIGPFAVFVRTAFAGLIVLALTRPRSRAFFTQAAPGPLGEG